MLIFLGALMMLIVGISLFRIIKDEKRNRRQVLDQIQQEIEDEIQWDCFYLEDE